MVISSGPISSVVWNVICQSQDQSHHQKQTANKTQNDLRMPAESPDSQFWVCCLDLHPGGGGGGDNDLERGYGDVRPWRPPFHASPAARKGPISSKRVSSQDPLLRKFGNFSLNTLNFHPNFSSQAPKFGNFQLTSPQIWKFSAHKPPPFQRQMSVRKPHTSELWAANPYLKKSWVPPPGLHQNQCSF